MVSRENKLVLSVKDTAILLSSNPEQIREAIDNGTFSFGRCITSANNKKIYKISKKGVLEFLGITEDEMNEFLAVKKGA